MKKILNRKKVLLPILINLLNNDEIWNAPYKKYSEWTPIAIIYILSVTGGKEAFETVNNAILTYHDETGWLDNRRYAKCDGDIWSRYVE